MKVFALLIGLSLIPLKVLAAVNPQAYVALYEQKVVQAKIEADKAEVQLRFDQDQLRIAEKLNLTKVVSDTEVREHRRNADVGVYTVRQRHAEVEAAMLRLEIVKQLIASGREVPLCALD